MYEWRLFGKSHAKFSVFAGVVDSWVTKLAEYGRLLDQA